MPFFNVTATSSGKLCSLKGNRLLPKPRLTIIVVASMVYSPAVYFGKTPWPGAYNPPTPVSYTHLTLPTNSRV